MDSLRKASNLKWNKSFKAAEVKRKNKLKAVEYKGGMCEICKQVFPPCVYDFHHADPTEKKAVGSTFLSWSWVKMKTELDKCILLCSNCHRLEHNKGKKMNEQTQGFSTQFNGDRMKASIEAAQAKEGVQSSQDMKGLLDASFEPGDEGTAVQTDADINP